MDNEKEKTIEPFELDDKDKELIELIRHMNKEDRDKELKDYDELAEKWVREEDGENVARTAIGVGMIASFAMEGALYLPDDCTVELHAFDDSEEAEKYIRSL